MGKIVYLMGKSSTGKDTIYKKLLRQKNIPLKTIVPYTTRPIRLRETDGVEYHFTGEEGYQTIKAEGKIIEERSYQTCHGLWRYFTVDDGQIQLNGKEDYLYIGTLESYNSTATYYGKEKLVPVLIELDDGVRLQRALDREKKQPQPKYQELCRRFLADQEDFLEEKIEAAGITQKARFQNEDLETCLTEIIEYVKIEVEGK